VINKHFVFLSGLPRTGSQVLSSLLNQHPLIHGSTTSPLAELSLIIFEQWPMLSQSLNDPDPNQFSNIVTSVFQGTYQHIQKPIIVDKNRRWPRYIAALNQGLKQRPKIICTVRDIPSIIASYLLLIKQNSDRVTFIDQDLLDNRLPVTNKNRCKLILEKYIMHPYQSLRLGYNSADVDLLFLDYNEIVNHSQSTLNQVCDFIGIEHCQADLNNLQAMDENDNYHGGIMGLHRVRPVMAQTSPPSEQVLGQELYNQYCSMKLEFWKQ
jgi:hypothetical protein